MDNRNAKLRLLALSKILFEKTDEDHSLTTNQLLFLLERDYNIPTHRTTIPGDIEILQKTGMDIQVVKSSQTKYNLVSRDFDYAELRLLMDAVASSRFISKDKSQRLITKLAKLGGEGKSQELKRNIDVERRIKTDNERVLCIIDAVNEAINKGKKITFQYFEYNIKKERILRHDGQSYIITPYRLVWNGDYYYIVAKRDGQDFLSSFRVDRIAGTPQITDDAAEPLPDTFDMDTYLNTMMRMFSTERSEVTLRCDADVMDSIIDRFGEDIEVTETGDDRFEITVSIAINKLFFTWIAGFEGKVTIQKPADIKAEFEEMIRRIYNSL